MWFSFIYLYSYTYIILTGNNYVTVSLIIPMTFGIQNFLKESLTKITTEEGKIFCNNF